MIRKAYIDTVLEGHVRQTHYRTAGRGVPVVALHPSPLSSAFLAPVIDAFSPHLQVIAPDTPGYGGSDPLPKALDGEGLAPYVCWLLALLDAVGLQRAAIYGSATGAQIAIAFALRHPERVDELLLENVVHFDHDEREQLLEHYFPDLTPRRDGSHLGAAWAMATGLFRGFPWYRETASPRPAVPVEMVNRTALATLRAGPAYDRAYRAAFCHERAERLQALQVPATVLRWAGGLLERNAERLDDFDWPDQVRMVHVPAGQEARVAALSEWSSRIAGSARQDSGRMG